MTHDGKPFVARDLDRSGARAYVLEILSRGLTLGRLVSKRLAAQESGRLFALASPDLPTSSLYEFQYGKLMSAERGIEACATTVVTALRGLPQGAIIGESADVQADDPAVSSWPSTRFSHGRELYFRLFGSEATVESVARMLRVIGAIWTSNVFVVGRDGFDQSLSGNVDPEVLARLAAHVKMVVVLAYDGEGYVVWEL